MAKMFSSGPAIIFSEMSGGSVKQLGTCEGAPEIQIQGEFEPIYNDLGGTQLPIDRIWEGEEALVNMILTRWNQDVLEDIMGVLTGGVGGTQYLADVGSIMGQEGHTRQLWVFFPFSLKPEYADMPGGYHFLATMRVGPQRINPGTGVNKHQLIMKAQRKMSTSIPSSLNSEVFKLYDHDMSGISGIQID